MYGPGVRLSTPRLRPAGLVLAVVLPLGLAACSGTSSSDATTTTRAAGRVGATSVCATVTPAQIKTTLDRAVKAPGVANTTAATACTYPSSDPSTPADAVIISFRSHVTNAAAGAEQASLDKLHGTTTDVSGVGDVAYYYTVNSGGRDLNTLVVLVGETQVTITSTAPITSAETLAKQIFATFSAQATTTTAPAG